MKITIEFKLVDNEYETSIKMDGDILAVDAYSVFEGAAEGLKIGVQKYLERHPEHEDKVDQLTIKDLEK